MRSPDGSGLRMVTLVLGLVAGGGSWAGCHKTTANQAGQGQPAPNPEAVKQSLAKVRKQFDGLQQRSALLSKQIEAIPAELPGYPQLRASYYAFEEARGVTDAKVTLLSGRLDAALKSGNANDLQQVSNDVARALQDAGQIDQQYIRLLHEAMTYERAAERRKDAVAASNSAPAPAKARPAKSKHRPE